MSMLYLFSVYLKYVQMLEVEVECLADIYGIPFLIYHEIIWSFISFPLAELEVKSFLPATIYAYVMSTCVP
jgi:hypothetical protein